MNAQGKFRLFACALVAAALLYGRLWPGDALPPPAASATPDYFPFVRSMEGTRPDGALTLASGDTLVVDAELGHLFDYYLAGLGEKDLQAIRAEIERELTRRLAPGPAAQAKRLLASYLAYKQALVGVEQALPPAPDMLQGARQRLASMRQLRSNYFNPADIAGLFGASDDYDDDALARLAISQDQTLDAGQKRQRLTALDASLPAALRAERDEPVKVIKLEASVQAMRQQGASDDEVYRTRAAALSPAAADRLAAVDREEAAWKSRISDYLNRRGQLPRGEAGEAALQQLRESSFSNQEQGRLAAYE